jgi:hypothetical protein
MTSPYTDRIREQIATLGSIGADPRHVEAYMRLEHPMLDGLSPRQFRTEVQVALDCLAVGGCVLAERCAKSFGL